MNSWWYYLKGVGKLAGLLLRHRHEALLLVALGALAALYVLNQENGVDWGDDFALYLHQARGIVDGSAARVIDTNRYALEHSSWSTFSPEAYPWGWPLLLSPAVWIFGLDYTVLKLLEVAALCVVLSCYWHLVARRAGRLPAWVLFGVVALSPLYLSATDTVLSDLPYAAFAFATLVQLDRVRRAPRPGGRLWDLTLLGLLLAAALNIRREGVALLAAVAATQGIEILRAGRWRLSRSEIARLATPYAVAIAVSAIVALALPGPVVQRVEGAGIGNVHGHLPYYGDVIGEALSLKAAGGGWSLLGSPSMAQWVATILVAMAVAGLVARLIRDFAAEAPLAAYVLAVTSLILATPAQEPRYLLSVIPFITYYAYQLLPTLAANATAGAAATLAAVRVGKAVAVVAMGVLLVTNGRAAFHATRYHVTYRYTNPGPSTAAAQQMFGEVRTRTSPEDVIGFFRARAMSLYTERRALQLTQVAQISERADWYVMVKGSSYSQALLTDADAAAAGLTDVWENTDFVLWQVKSG